MRVDRSAMRPDAVFDRRLNGRLMIFILVSFSVANDSRKIIDFESARQAFERDHSVPNQGEEFKSTFLSDLKADRSASLAESLVTIVLVLVNGLSLFLGMIWGF
jgi:hypothetical protein